MQLTSTQLLRISRPHFWLYELGTFFIGVLVGVVANEALWSIEVLVFAVFFLFPANLLIYGINDIYDYETDIKNPKKAGYEQVLPKVLHRTLFAYIAVLVLPFFFYGLTQPPEALFSLIAFFFFAYFYSAPPIRAKARPFLDSIFSAGHYVATAVFGYYLAGGDGGVWLSVAAGMAWAIAMHAYSAVPDIQADSEAGLVTIATKLGPARTIIMCFGFYTLSAVIAYWYLGLIALLLYAPYAYMMIRSLHVREEALMRLYTFFPYINACVGMAIFFTVLLQKGWL